MVSSDWQELLAFDRELRQHVKKSMVIELQSTDVFGNIGGFHFLREFLREHGVADYQLVDSQGATEGTVKNLTAEAVADITSTGETLKANHLRILDDGVILRSEIDDALPEMLRGDPTRIRQILFNLVSNALKFTEDGEIVVRISVVSKEAQNIVVRTEVEDSGIGIKPVSRERTARRVRKAIQYAIDNDRKSLTLVHKGNIMKFTEGAFKDWGYELAKNEFGATELDGGPWCTLVNPRSGNTITINDVIADNFLQQILLRPQDYEVIATMNLNGDYISDALAAQVGGIGMAPGANLSDQVALFEATHGTAPKYAGKDQVNPSSLILSAEMMLRHLGWNAAADLIVNGLSGAIAAKTVTYDLERLMPGASKLSCSAFGQAIIAHMR